MESMCKLYQSQGIEVLFLTTCDKGDIHRELEKMNIRTFFHPVTGNKFYRLFSQILFLLGFCRKKKINVVHSHLQDANLISVFAQFLIKGRVVIFRHHFSIYDKPGERIKRNRNEALGEKIINILAPEITVPSRMTYNSMIKIENVNQNKIGIVPYTYDFDKYNKPNLEHVAELIHQYPAELRLVMCSRLIKGKQHLEVFVAFEELVKTGLDLILFILDDGPERINLEEYVKNRNLKEKIIFLGFRKDFMDFMAASDLLVHPSIAESSNSSVKEMGLAGKTVAVCKGVGDFEDYIVDNQSGYYIDPEQMIESLKKIIVKAYRDKNNLGNMGNELKKSVESTFGINSKSVERYMKYV